jgi:hypothetical protein
LAYYDTSVVNGVTYSYAVAGVSGSVEGLWSAIATCAPQAGLPVPPANVVARPGNGAVTLTWDAVPGVRNGSGNYYTIWGGTTPGGPYYQYGHSDGASGEPISTVTGFANGTTYYFVVESENLAGDSGVSAEVAFRPTASGLARPSLTPTRGSNLVSLSWTQVASATGYSIYRFVAGDPRWQVIGRTSGTSFVDTGLVNGTPVSYAVAPRSGSAESAWSNIGTATPGP